MELELLEVVVVVAPQKPEVAERAAWLQEEEVGVAQQAFVLQ